MCVMINHRRQSRGVAARRGVASLVWRAAHISKMLRAAAYVRMAAMRIIYRHQWLA